MKQQILNALKTKFVGVSETILDRIATKLAQTVTTAEQVQTAVDGVTIQQIIESYGDARATQAQQTAIHNYETKHGLKDGVKLDTRDTGTGAGTAGAQQNQGGQNQGSHNNQGGGQEAVPAWAQALTQSLKTLSDQVNGMQAARTTETRKSQIATLIDKLPGSLKKAYERTPVDKLTDEEFNTLVGEITTEVGEIQSSISQKGAIFGKPAAQNIVQTNELTKEQVDAISKRSGAGTGTQPF